MAAGAMFLLLIALPTAAARDTLIHHTPSGPEDASFIVGGDEIDPAYKYPFLVSLRYYSSHICGGSLIEPNWVLSKLTTTRTLVYRVPSLTVH